MRKNRIMRSAVRGINLQGAGDAINSLERHIEIGVVRAEDGDVHYWIEDGAVWVDVVIMPEEAPVTCRLTAVAGGPGNGVWKVPDDGTEVVVSFPGGSMDNGGIILCVLDSAQAPDGIDDTSIVIVAPKVYVYDSDKGQAAPLATKADIDALAAHVDGHVHVYLPDATSIAKNTTVPSSGAPTYPVPTAVDTSPPAAGTQVLESE